jgi:lipid A 3-O-deacylase
LTLSIGVGDEFGRSVDYNLSAAWSRFVVDDLELGVEGALWYFDQDEYPTWGLNSTFFLRWHFVRHETWSLFADPGLGILLSADDVPPGGTTYNFTPRGGVGATFRLTDDIRLETGLRWTHISNGDIGPPLTNPSRDAAMLYVGVILPF